MSKINLNSRLWKNSAGGRLELIDFKVDQSVVVGSNVVFNDIQATGNVIIDGDLTVQGTTTAISSEVIEMQDNIILINAEETGSGVTANLSGLEVERGTLVNQRIVFQESDDNWRIGEVGDTQALATREDSPLDNGIMTWNSTDTRLDSVNDILIDIKFSGSNPTDIFTGAIHTSGGIGVEQDIHIGGTLYLLGTTPNYSTIDSDAGNNLILTSVQDISLVPSAGKDVNIPFNIGLTFGSDLYKIESNGIDLTLNSNSDINLTPAANINIPNNRNLTFGSDSRNINSNGTVLNITSDGDLNINSTSNDIIIDSNTGTTTIDGDTSVVIQSDGLVSIDSTDAGSGVSIGLTSGVPVNIGHTTSETTVNDNLTVLGELSLVGTTTFDGQVVIDLDSTEAVLVRKDSDSGDVFTIDTTNSFMLIQNPDAPTNSNVFYLYNPSKTVNNSVSMFWDLNESTDTRSSYVELQGLVKTNTTTAEDGALNINISTNGSLDTYMTFNGELNLIQTEVPTVLDITSTEAFLVRKNSDGGDIFTIDTSGENVIADARLIIDRTDTEALLIRKNSDSGDVFTIDTTNEIITSNAQLIIDDANTDALLVRVNGGGDTVLGVDTIAARVKIGNGDAVANSGILSLYGTAPNLVTTTDEDTFPNIHLYTSSHDDMALSFDAYYDGAWKSSDVGSNFQIRKISDELVFNTENTIAQGGSITWDTAIRIDNSGIATFEKNVILDSDSTEAFLVRGDSDSGDQFIVDTTNNRTISLNTFRIGAATDGIDFAFNGTDTLNISAVNATDKININNSVSVLEIVNNLDINGQTFLDQTSIVTDDGTFQVSGSNSFDFDVAAASRIVTSTGNLTIDAESGTLILDGNSSVTIDSTGSISIDASSSSNFTTSSGTLTLNGSSGINIQGNASEVDITTTGNIDLNSGGVVSIDTTNTGSGITIGTATSGVPISIGHTVSETTVNDNFNVNGITSLQDSLIIDTTNTEALLVRKNADSGDVFIIDTTNSRIGINKTPSSSLDILGDSIFNGLVTIDHDSTVALVVRKNGGGNTIFSVDTVNSISKVTNGHLEIKNVKFESSSNNLDISANSDSITLIPTDGSVTGNLEVNTTNLKYYNDNTQVVLQLNTDSSVAPSLTGKGIRFTPITIDDDTTAESATATNMAFHSIEAPTLTATNATVTTTDAATVYFSGAPIAGTNQTITNSYSMWVGSGMTRFDGVHLQNSNMILDSDSTEALLVRKDSDGGDVFTVDTTNARVHISDANYYLRMNTNPEIVFDSGDFITYNRTSNTFDFYTGSTSLLTLNSTNLTSQVPSIIDTTSTEAFLVRKNSDGGDIFIIDTTNNLVKVMNSCFDVAGSISGTPSTMGHYICVSSSTFTDNVTAESGTAATMVFHSLAAPSLAASNATVTTTNAATLYIAGAPSEGTNQTITNAYSLWIPSGDVRIDSDMNCANVIIDSTSTEAFLVRKNADSGDVFIVDTTNSNVEIASGNSLIVSDNTASTSKTSGAIQIAGGFGVGGNSFIEDANLTIHDTDTFALLVEKTDGTDIFRVNTTDSEITLNSTAFITTNLTLGSARSGTPSPNGSYLHVLGNIFTDNNTASSGTVASMNFNSINKPTLAASNTSITTSIANTLYIEGAPATGTNETITEKYALYVAADNVRFVGDLFVDGAITSTASLTSTITLDYNSVETLLIRKDSDGGDVFRVDTVNEKTIFSKDTNGVGDRVKTEYKLFNSASAQTVFGKIDMELDIATSTNETGSFYISAIKNGSMKDYIVINGANDTIDIPSNVSLIFGDTTENIVGNATALTLNSGEDIYLNATSKVNIPSNVNLTFGDDGENIVGNGTDMSINSSNKINITAVTIDANISGSLDFIGGANSNFNTTSGNITIDSQAGNLVLDGNSSVTIDSANGGISIDAAGASNFSTTSGTLTLNGIGINIAGNSGEVDITTTGAVDINSGGAVTIDTTSTGSGITIGTSTSAVPITIGHSVSETTIGDNLTVNGNLTVSGTTTTLDTQTLVVEDNLILTNSSPSGPSDSGVVGKRYQPQNNSSLGEVVSDTADVTGTAQAGSNTTITLAAGASASNDFYNGWWIKITAGTGSGQVRQIKDYVGSTKVATIFDSADEIADPQIPARGANFSTNPDNTSVYSLHSGTYAGTFFDESLNEWAICYTADSPGNGSATITRYVDLHVNSLITETALGVTGLLVDQNNIESILVRNDGDSGDVFVVDTVNNKVTSYVDFTVKNSDAGNNLFEILDGSNNPVITIGNSTSSTSDIRFNGAAGSTQSIYFNNGSDLGKLQYSHSTHTFEFIANSSSRLKIDDASIESEGPFIIDSTNTETFLVRKNSDGGDVFVIDTTNSIVKVNNSCFDVTGTISGTPSTMGHFICVSASTFTDNATSASGTAAAMVFHSLAAPTLAASNSSITTTNAATFYIEGCPMAGTNQTLTNCYSLWVDSGDVKFDANLIVDGSISVGSMESLIIDSNSTEALLVRKNGDTGDIFTVDTTNSNVLIGPGSALANTSMLSLYGTTNSAPLGPHITSTTTQDTYPVFQQLSLAHNNVHLALDAYYDGTWKSSSANGNFRIAKGTYVFDIDFDTAISQGSAITWENAINIDVTTTPTMNINTRTVIDVTSTEALLVRKNSDGGDIFTVNTSGNIVQVLDSQLNIDGSITGTPSLLGGFISASGDTFTDNNTSASGTAANMAFYTIATPTLAASNASVTTTNAANLYIAGAPSAGTNQTITNSYALWVDSGKVRIDGDLEINGAVSVGVSSPAITVSASNLVNIAAAGNVTAQYKKLIKNGTNRSLWISFHITPTIGGVNTSFRFTVPELTTISNKYDITGTIQGYLDSNDTNIENKVVVAVPADDNCKIQFTSIDNTTHTIQIQINYDSN